MKYAQKGQWLLKFRITYGYPYLFPCSLDEVLITYILVNPLVMNRYGENKSKNGCCKGGRRFRYV